MGHERGKIFGLPFHVREGDHRGNAARRKKHGKFVHKISRSNRSGFRAQIQLRWQQALFDSQSFAEVLHLVSLGLKVVVVLICENEVQGHQPGPHELELMVAPVADILFADPRVNLSGKEMEHAGILRVRARVGMPVREHLMGLGSCRRPSNMGSPSLWQAIVPFMVFTGW